MNKFIFNKNQFLYGVSKSAEVGRGFPRLDGVDLHRNPGFIESGFDSTSTGISTTISWMAVDNETTYYNSWLWMVGKGKIYKWHLDNDSLDSSVSTNANYGRGGACVFNDYLYVGSKLGVNAVGRFALSGTEGWTTGWKSTDQTDYYEMVKYKNNLYGTGGKYVWATTTDAAFDSHALELESQTMAISLAPYGEYLAIGAIRGERFPSAALGEGEGLLKSKLYFWDTLSASWDKDRSTEISGRILKVLNKKGVLHIIIEDADHEYSINYFDGNSIQFLKKIECAGDGLQRPGQDAYDIVGDMTYIGTGCSPQGTYKSRVWAYGQKDLDTPVGLSVPFRPNSATIASSSDVHSVKWAKPDQFFVACKSGVTNDVKIFKSANGYGTYGIKTPAASTGVNQMSKSIRINTKPLASGDMLSVYRRINNGSWDSSVWTTDSFAQSGASTSFNINTEFEFRNLEIQVVSIGDIKIKDIIIKSEDIDEP